jgi:hypothetical protein
MQGDLQRVALLYREFLADEQQKNNTRSAVPKRGHSASLPKPGVAVGSFSKDWLRGRSAMPPK